MNKPKIDAADVVFPAANLSNCEIRGFGIIDCSGDSETTIAKIDSEGGQWVEEKWDQERCLIAVFNFFEGDLCKTIDWFRTKNPMLGNLRPYTMVKVGRAGKLWAFIKDSMGLE